MRSTLAALALLSTLLAFSIPLQAQNTPEAAYAEWVAASKAGDLDKMLALSSKEKVDDFNKDITTPEKKAEIREIAKLMAPIKYQVKKSELSKGGNKATLQLDALARDFFSLNDPKAKPQQENIEVKLVKEGGVWKVDKQCSGKDGCGKEPDWVQGAWGKPLSLPKGATVKVVPGKTGNFGGAKAKGKAYAVDLIFTLPQNGPSLSYFLHRSPTFAEFYLMSQGETLTPIARREDFPGGFGEGGPDIKVLEENTSYSRSTGFTGTGTLSLLFDIPKELQGDKLFRFIVTVDDEKYPFEIR
ncbi:MAG: hypothetical protein U1F66_06175 [bacterium]